MTPNAVGGREKVRGSWGLTNAEFYEIKLGTSPCGQKSRGEEG